MKKFKKGCGVVCIGLVAFVMLIALASSGMPSVDDVVGPTGITDPFAEVQPSAMPIPVTPEPIETVKPITCRQIKDGIDGMTDFQRNQYLEKLHGKVLNWQVQVRTVDEMFDIYAIFETEDGCEIRLDDLDVTAAGALIIDQWYVVSGPVKSWSTLFGLQAELKTSESTID